MSKKLKTKYSTEFRERAINMVIKSDKPASEIAKDLGLNKSTLYSWLNKETSGKITDTNQTNEELFDELRRVKKELTEVKEQRDILKKATAYFANESR